MFEFMGIGKKNRTEKVHSTGRMLVNSAIREVRKHMINFDRQSSFRRQLSYLQIEWLRNRFSHW